MAKRRRRRRQPIKRALTATQVAQQIARYDRLLEKGIAKATQHLKRVDTYRRKLNYYTKRQQELQAARAAADDAAGVHHGRELRSVEVQ